MVWHFNLQIEMRIGDQMRRTIIPNLKPILNTSQLKTGVQILMKLYIFLSLTIGTNCNTATQIEGEKELLNTSLIEGEEGGRQRGRHAHHEVEAELVAPHLADVRQHGVEVDGHRAPLPPPGPAREQRHRGYPHSLTPTT